MDFTGKIIVERTRTKERASVKEQGTSCLQILNYLQIGVVNKGCQYLTPISLISLIFRPTKRVWSLRT